MSSPCNLTTVPRQEFIDSWRQADEKTRNECAYEFSLLRFPEGDGSEVLFDTFGNELRIEAEEEPMGKANFTKQAQRGSFREAFHNAVRVAPGESTATMYLRAEQKLHQYDVYISATAKTFWDSDGNRCSNPRSFMYQQGFIQYLRNSGSDRLGNPGKKYPSLRQKDEAPKPAKPKVPAKMGWDDFDWTV